MVLRLPHLCYVCLFVMTSLASGACARQEGGFHLVLAAQPEMDSWLPPYHCTVGGFSGITGGSGITGSVCGHDQPESNA